jgi:SAM-dependent methyltransferase
MMSDVTLSRIEDLRAFARSLPFPLDRCVRWAGGTMYRLYHQARTALHWSSQVEIARPEARPAPPPAEQTATQTSARDRDRAQVSAFWAVSPEDRAASGGMNWLHHPLVARRVAIKAADRPESDAYVHLFEVLRGAGWRFPVPRALSLGCGHGGLERGLMLHGVVERCDGIDLSEGAIEEARRRAAEAGMPNIHYTVGDLEHADFPEGAFDMVFFHHSMHHIEDLDGLCLAVRRALRPGGILHLNEFVGPDRFQWTDAQLHHLNTFVQALPSRYRRLHTGNPMPMQVRATVEQMIAFDPSEAVRSSAIMETVRRHFRVVEVRELGGALLHVGLSGIAQNFDPQDPEAVAHLEAFFELEDRLMAEGVIGSDFVTVTAIRD